MIIAVVFTEEKDVQPEERHAMHVEELDTLHMYVNPNHNEQSMRSRRIYNMSPSMVSSKNNWMNCSLEKSKTQK